MPGQKLADPSPAGAGHLSSIAGEYAAAWQQALSSFVLPNRDSFLQLVDDGSQARLRELLQGIDQQYGRELLEAASGRTQPNWSDATVRVPPQSPAATGAEEAERRPGAGVIDRQPPARPGTAASDGTQPNWNDATVVGPAPLLAPDSADRHVTPAERPPASEQPFAATASFVEAEVGTDARPQPDRFAPTIIGTAESGEPQISWDEPLPVSDNGRVGQPRLPGIPGYEILGVLGRGGMGVVYRARQIGLNRIVALKMILAGDHAAPDHVARFRTEAEAVALMQHSNIVQIFEIGDVDGLPFFSLEFVDGKSLEQERAGKPLPPDRAAGFLVTLARAMHYAHQRGIVHRDLKPANVLLTSDGVPKVSDFGLVKRVEGDSSETRTGTIVGTPSYMAPEQAWGQTDIGPLADVYALGAILYTLLTGRPPFLGTSPLETIMQLRQQEPVAPSRLQPNLPRDLETICLKALQKSPQSRYASAADLADDLERFRRNEPILARPVSRLERTWRWCRRNPALAISGGAALALALCLMIGGPLAAAMIYDQKEQAVEAREEADQNATLAVNNQRQAERNAEVAGENAGLAVRRLEIASILVEKFTDAVQDQLGDMARTQRLRTDLLNLATNGLKTLVETGGEVEGQELIMARSRRKLGDVLLETGKAAEAGEQYQETHEIVLSMTKSADPGKPHVPHLNLGRSYVNLGKAAQRTGNARAARDYFLQSLRSREQALPLAPGNGKLFVKQEIADAYGHLGSISLALGQVDEALDYFQKELELRREKLESAPDDIPALREFAGVQLALATADLDRGKLDDALRRYGEALELLRRVAKAEPAFISSRGNVGFVHNQRGAARLFAQQPADARTEYQQAATIFEDLTREDPENAEVRRKLGTALYGLATACLEAGDAEAARTHFARCLEIRRQLAEKDPEDATLQADLLLALARVGDHATAAGLAEAIAKQSPDDASLLYVVAGGYALASRAAGDAPAAGRYAEQATAALAQAIEHGYRGLALIRMDPDLDPLRDRPEFQKLLEQLEQNVASRSERTAAADGQPAPAPAAATAGQ